MILIFGPRHWPLLLALPAYVFPAILSLGYAILILHHFGIAEAISNGMFHASMKDKMDTLETRKAELGVRLALIPAEDPFILHPALAEVYGANIKALANSLDDEDTKPEAIELLRSFVTEVRLHPDADAKDGHSIELYGELVAILELSDFKKTNPDILWAGYRYYCWLRE